MPAKGPTVDAGQSDGTPNYVYQTQPAQGAIQRVSAGYVSPGQTAKSWTGKTATSVSAVTNVSLGSVTAGKTLIITDIFVSTDSAVLLDLQLQAAAANIFRAFCRDLAPVQAPGIETQPSGAAGNAMQLVLPQTPTGVQNVIYTITGIEQ